MSKVVESPTVQTKNKELEEWLLRLDHENVFENAVVCEPTEKEEEEEE